MKKRILAVTTSISLASCFPIVEQIYQPRAQGGTILESTCHYDSGPGRWDKIELTQDGVTIHAHTEKDQGQLSVLISIFVPEGKAVRFTRAEATISAKESTQQVSIATISSYDRAAGKLAQQEPASQMVGGKVPKGVGRYERAGAGSKEFSTTVMLPTHYLAQSFTLEIPSLQSGSGYISFQPIHFVPVMNARVGSLCP